MKDDKNEVMDFMFIKDFFNKFRLLFSKKTPALPNPVANNFDTKTLNLVSQLKEENLPEFSPEVLSFNTLDGAIEQYIISYLKKSYVLVAIYIPI